MAGLSKITKLVSDYAKKNPDKVKNMLDKGKEQLAKRKGGSSGSGSDGTQAPR